MKIIDLINRTPTAYHAVANVREILLENGFTELYECGDWKVEKGGRYFVTRNLSSVIAFEVPDEEYVGLAVCASHTDSPSFKLKTAPELAPADGIVRLNVEGYGSMLRRTWFDRPLSIAGRIVTEDEDGISERLVDIGRDLVIIPSLAIHMGSTGNEEKVNIQTEMLPILKTDSAKAELMELIAESAGTEPEKIKGCDLFLYNRQPGVVFGAENEFIAGGRLDNLENVYLSLSAFIDSDKSDMLKVFAAFDNEETGSLTRQGAESTFFAQTIERINDALGVCRKEYIKRLASSFMLSADNAHAAHPNYPAKADITNRPRINGGIVLKFNASGRYTTDAVSAAAVRVIAERAGVPVQEYHNRSDIPGGSTLGNLMNRQFSVMSADIGLAQLAMHSAYETAGAKDAEYMEGFIREFYSTCIRAVPGGKLDMRKKTKMI